MPSVITLFSQILLVVLVLISFHANLVFFLKNSTDFFCYVLRRRRVFFFYGRMSLVMEHFFFFLSYSFFYKFSSFTNAPFETYYQFFLILHQYRNPQHTHAHTHIKELSKIDGKVSGVEKNAL